MQEGELSLKLDGVWSVAKAGDLVRMPRGIPHGYFNKSDKPARALFWVSPAGKLEDLFKALNGLTDVPEVFGSRPCTRWTFCRQRQALSGSRGPFYQSYSSATHRAQTRATARARIRASAIRR